jgi:hypothetical protein
MTSRRGGFPVITLDGDIIFGTDNMPGLYKRMTDVEKSIGDMPASGPTQSVPLQKIT